MKVAILALIACLFAISLAQDSQGRCAYCTGKTCGPNGIGGSCGTCPTGQRCSRGTCICDRGCTGFECGPDRCGTTCGDCLAGQTCVSGKCTGACTPQCVRSDGTVRSCGWDRCGGCCGSCPQGFRCRDGTCECYPDCENKHCGSDGCGGSCGSCLDGAICQGSTDTYPQQCYFNCHIDIRVEVRELKTNSLVSGSCRVDVTGPLNFASANNVYTGPTPGFFTLDVSTGKFGNYQFTTTCPGYIVDLETHAVNVSGQLVTIFVDWNPILIEVRDQDTNQLLPSASISISSGTYSLSVQWSSPSYSWSHNGFKSYTFTTSSSGYVTRTVTVTVTANTTLITLFLSKAGINIRVQECVTGDAVSTATITVGGTTINYNNGATFTPTNGFTSYTFTTASTNYVTNTQTVSVTTNTTLITLCVNYRPINFIVTSCQNSATLLNGASVRASSSFYSSYSLTFTYSSAGTTWTPVGYSGTYTFNASSSGYITKAQTFTVTPATNTLSMCLDEAPFCGDGVCSGSETANPGVSTRCFDCGRLRGVISLAVGQKDQLVNITVSVWSDPVNPALFLRNGTAVPTPHFVTLSDSKGFFSFNTLSFDAGTNNRAQGQAKRRFYFSLTGSFVDRTSGIDTTITLLPLWWNYELTNTQWSGQGNLTNTNNSPSFYFYMTPPFNTSDALIRVILSWGTLISNPANSLPDVDLVVAGPVDQASITLYGTGIINFQNKDQHSSTRTTLPYAKLVTDSAQGYGPEVMDFYGSSSSGSLSLGFSSTYQAGAAANAYEIWVDRPNSSPNQDSILTFLYDTNAFIVVYQNDGTASNAGGKQTLFDARTGVPYAYGFYNTDQWNKVPTDATLWHIIDLSQAAGGILFNGFPGENSTVKPSTVEAGAKYGYDASFFEATKSIPCGHVASRGANPAYCPATLSYPQSKK